MMNAPTDTARMTPTTTAYSIMAVPRRHFKTVFKISWGVKIETERYDFGNFPF
jgi:hypothetical protein